MWIDVNQLGPTLTRHHGEAKSDGVRFRHVGTHEQNAIAVLQILLKSSSRSPAQRGAQTGHRSAVSNTSLIFYGNYA